MTAPARDTATRIADARRRLATDADLWVATAGAGGEPALVPLSFHWDGATLLMATPAGSAAGRNMARSGQARLALGHTRDVVLIEATVAETALTQVDDARWVAFADAVGGWDPREDGPAYRAYLATPGTVRAWREVNELRGRTIMRDGRWLEG